MAKRPAFLKDSSQFDITRTQFRKMRKADKRQAMIDWFRQNYEDPAERTSYVSAEGGYLWNRGGPYDATEELYEKFDGIAPQALIEEVIFEVQRDGILEWAPNHDDHQDDYDGPEEARPSFEDFSDDPNDRYGSQQDLEARERARYVLKELLDMLDLPRPVGMGHNNPPETLDDTEIVESLREPVAALHAELGEPNPSISLIKKAGEALAKTALASIKWGGKKIDLAIDISIKTGIPAVGAVVAATYNDQIHKAIDVVISWLKIVAQMH
ncbi:MULTISPECIES: hypothetical protein [unclassified Bradyrhizobium]|uniref:hypothetical protein n=1 Tax=unclassified Bradyrhizobium TaxID=2631580 RepID=UPI002479E979|nr:MULTISPECIES: hypothetical protein [unclassified Bradyrhizobium]WGS22486.1 hypothetical protein MTX22_12950 [Bradyrhizobium sp. ISRA463]WGS29461.1 hypothetical protein MTX19_10720 [Bradyrhizobium sp. ISRA464]